MLENRLVGIEATSGNSIELRDCVYIGGTSHPQVVLW